MTRRASTTLLLALALLALAGVPLLGRWAFVPATLLLLLAAWRALPSPGVARWDTAATVAGTLGGGIGVVAAMLAVAELGGDAAYSARAGYGGAALALAALAMIGGALARSHPRMAIALLLAGSTAGALAMSLFTINSWYYVAVPLCWLGAALTAIGPPSRARQGV